MGATLSVPCRPAVRRAKGRQVSLARMGVTLSVPACLAARGAIKVLGPVGMPLPVPCLGKGPFPCKQGLGQRAAKRGRPRS